MSSLEEIKLLKMSDVARILNMTPKGVRELALAGRIPYFNVGLGKKYRSFRFRESDIAEFIEQTSEPARSFTPAVRDQNNQPVNTADRIAIQKLRQRGLIK